MSLAMALYCSCDSVSEAVCIPCPLLFQATSVPASDQLLVYVVAEFAADLFPESKMFTLGSGGPNDNNKYTNPTLQHSTAYTYFVICFPDTTPESLNVGALEPCCCCTQCRTMCFCLLFVCLFHRTHLHNVRPTILWQASAHLEVNTHQVSGTHTGPAITVNFNQLQVDTTCPVVIDSLIKP